TVAIVVGYSGLIGSMYHSIDEWMDNALNPDFFIAPSANLTSRTLTFPGEIGTIIEHVEGVDQVQLVRSARLTYQQRPVLVLAVDTEKVATTVRRVPLEGDRDEMNRLVAAGKG